MIDKKIEKILLGFQKNEITEYYVYRRLARLAKGDNQSILNRMANDEKRHYVLWRKHSGKDIHASQWKIFKYSLLAKIFGLTFAIKFMEKGENKAQRNYSEVLEIFSETRGIMADEHRHEAELIAMIEEKKLNYMGSVVLGLNDALVELTGALAGLSFALRDTRLIALVGLVTGIAASMSMASSEYLSKKSEHDDAPVTSALYTGIAYIITVLLLILPFLILPDYRISLAVSLVVGVGIIATFTFFNTVTRNMPFKRNFWEMIVISFGVAFLSFVVGLTLRQVMGVE